MYVCMYVIHQKSAFGNDVLLAFPHDFLWGQVTSLVVPVTLDQDGEAAHVFRHGGERLDDVAQP